MTIETIVTPQIVERWTAAGYWSTSTLGDNLDETVERYPDRTAFVQGDKRLTYREFGTLVNRLAANLLELSIRKQDFVIVELPNCFEFPLLQYALAKIGAIHIPVVHTYRQAEIEYVMRLCETKAIFIPDTFGNFNYAEMVRTIRPNHPYLKHAFVVGTNVPDGMNPFSQLVRERPDESHLAEHLMQFRPTGTDILRIQLSAGTTGKPKAALRSHNDTLCSLKWDAIRHQWGDALLLFFPFGHATGFFVSLDLQVMLGRKIVLFEGEINAEDVLRAIEKEQITALYIPMPTLSTLATQLKEQPEITRRYNLESLQDVVFGGTPALPDVVEAIHEILKVPVLQAYGMAEGIATSPDLLDPPNIQAFSVGRVGCPDADLRVVDDSNHDVPPGAIGELIYKGPFLFSGYYKDPEMNKQIIDEEGYLHSGDLVRIDEKGNIRIVGRTKDIIRRGGEGISPAEIEDLLLQHPKIKEVAVVAMPDKRMVEKACAYVVVKEGQTFTFNEMISFLKAKNIATFKLPERLEIIDGLPRSASKGHILKAVMREDVTNKLKAEGKI